MANEKKSIIKEAITDLKEITEAAELVAKNKLSEEYSDKFKNLVKEELDKDKKNKKSEKESYKKVDKKEESDEKEDKSEEENTKSTMKKDKEAKEVVKEERDKDFTGDVENDTPNLGKGETEKGDTFVDNITTKEESLAQDTSLKEEFNISELDLPDTETALDGASPDDEIITVDQIEQEIAEMEQLEAGLNEDKNDPFNELVKMRDKIDEMIEEQKNHGGKGANKVNPGGPTTSMIEEEEAVEEQKNHGGKLRVGKDGQHKAGGPDTGMIEEEEFDASELDDAIDEAQGGSLSSNKHAAGDHLPGKDYSDYKNPKKRIGSVNRQNEGLQKRVTVMLQENKKLTKRINESKKFKETVTKLVESYKTALDKYRTQLQEMSVYNTNLAHANNLFVNEELALTHKDKVNIIKEFKAINSIKGSQAKYQEILSEMKEGKQTITENVEETITESVGDKGKSHLSEVDEKTAYKNDKHINRMLKIMESIEKKDKKII